MAQANGRRPEQSKTALVLAGGGLTGAVYEIGALRAINDLLVGRTVNDFDLYVGTSAGALVAAGLANGMTPQMMLQTMGGTQAGMRPIRRRDIFTFNSAELLKRLKDVPRMLGTTLHHYRSHPEDLNILDFLWVAADSLPSALYDSMSIERYVRALLASTGRSNSFDRVARRLNIIATDLDSGERVVFGHGGLEDVPLSLAVAASAAVPLLYTPVRIGGREYVDGGLRGNASLDLAIEKGARLVVCINPLVPYNDRAMELDGRGYLSDRGMQMVADQVLRIVLHSGLHYHVKQLRRRHPDVDIILIEPQPDDFQMFAANIMRYSARMTIARHGYESLTRDLAADYHFYKDTLARHGIAMTPRHATQQLARMEAAGYAAEVVGDVLQSEDSAESAPHTNHSVVKRLHGALDDLDGVLARLGVNGREPE